MANPLPSSADQPINYGEVLERIGGDIPFLLDLLNLYFSEFAEKQHHLRDAIERSDFKLIQELGHSLKGSSANLSLQSLQKTAYALELSGKERRVDDARSALRSLDSELLRLKEYLEKHPLR
jgi:HPt (histidine-containing phosphotransfer) domain-containing protein